MDYFPRASIRFGDCSRVTKKKLFIAEDKKFKDEVDKEKAERCLVQPSST